MNQIIIGIDPGMSGAIAVLDRKGGLVAVYDMPTMPNGAGKKQQVNAAGVSAKIKSFRPAAVYLERVSSMPNQGVSSMFSFGESFGVVRGVTAALSMPIELITPQTWKRRFGLLGTEKDAARTKAIELYPAAPLARKKDIGRADALLIARYGWETEQQRMAANG